MPNSIVMGDDGQYDVIVIGGGPAGSTAAAVLADYGRRVLVFEKEKFPRYCVGESLMPYCYFPLSRLGVIDQLRTSHFPKKYSVQFVSTNGHVSQPFYFIKYFDHDASQTWQVWRNEFDMMLLDNARAKGAEVCEETRVHEIVHEGSCIVGVEAESKSGKRVLARAPITIDASGRNALAMSRKRWRSPDMRLKKIAIWTYYRGALRDAGMDEGATTIAYLPEKNWFWYIPLADDLVGVGIVAEREYLFAGGRDPAAIFEREIDKNPWIRDHLASGERVNAPGTGNGPFYTASEWSYRSMHCAADGLVLVGDAFGFLDPVFSSGVLLALKSGELAGDAVNRALDAGHVSANQFRDYGVQMSRGMEAMRKLVYAFYDHEFTFRELIEGKPELRGDLTDCLIGNLFRDFTDLFAAVGEFARLPEPVACSEPFSE